MEDKKQKFYFKEDDLTIRLRFEEESSLKSDADGYIIADLKSSVGITQAEIADGLLSKHSYNSYFKGSGSNQRGFTEALANGYRITELLNASHDINRLKACESLLESVLETNRVLKNRLLEYADN